MTAQWFDKANGKMMFIIQREQCHIQVNLIGIQELFQEELPPRICLRVLGSYRTIGIIFVSCLLGKLLFGSSILGLLTLTLLSFAYILLLAVFS